MSDITIERVYPTTPERVWELWTTPEGIERGAHRSICTLSRTASA